MSRPLALDPGAFIRGIYTEKLIAHEWSDPAGHEALRAIPGAEGRGWCEACATETTAEAIAAGYGTADVVAAFDDLVPPAYLDVLRAGTPAAPSSTASRGPGRPGWTDQLFADRYREARAVTSPPLTPARIAANLRMLDGTKGTTPEYLAHLKREHPTE